MVLHYYSLLAAEVLYTLIPVDEDRAAENGAWVEADETSCGDREVYGGPLTAM